MTPCPDPSQLEGLFQATLSPAEHAALERHLDTCASCSATVAELARLFGSATWGPSDASTDARSDSEPGRYQLGARLGAGGMGMVFEAEDRELHRRVALKLLYPDPTSDVELTRARLLREARAMARPAHPNVVAVYDVGRLGEQVFLAMEFVEGCTLTQWLRGGRTRKQILAAFVQAGRGLEAAHQAGLIHRDFKPDNVLVGDDGRVRVSDFGLALAARKAELASEGRAAQDIRASTQIATEHGAIVGTPAYMAPEQWRGQPADARSDQFSFCVALYEALFGVRPFAGDSVHSLAHAVLHAPSRPPPRNAPRWLRAALERGLSREPAARFADIGELLAVLERDRSKPWRALAVVGAVGIGAATAVGVFAWWTERSASEHDLPALEVGPPEVSTRALDECVVATEHGRGHWTPARRTALREHVEGMDDGELLVANLLPVLDAWESSWTAQAKQLCEPGPEFDHLEARTLCLDAALVRFDATIERIGELEGFQVAGALLGAARRLPSLDDCADAGWLSVAPAPPPEDKVAKAALLGKDLAALEAGIELEQYVAVRQDAERVVAAAEQLGYAPLLAEAQLARGRLEAALGETDLAIPWLSAAAETSELAGHERVLGLAALALVEQVGAGRLQQTEAKRWLRIAATLGERIGDPRWRGRTSLAEARMLAAVAEHRDALDALDSAEPLLREGLGDQHPLLVELELARSDSALASADLELADSAAERAEQLARAALGPAALDTARAEAARARVALARGRLDEAERLATAASRIPGIGRSRRHDHDRGVYLGLLGDIALARADRELALQRYHDTETYLYAAPESALPLLWQGVARLQAGELELARSLLDAGWAQLEGHWPSDDLRRIALLRLVGLAALDAGQLELARPLLERAVSLADEGLGFGPLLGRADADLGRLELAAGHPREALALLDDSYVGMVAGFGQRHPEVVAATLARADIAWDLDDHEYAGRLYRGVYEALVATRGGDDPACQRAAARRSQSEE